MNKFLRSLLKIGLHLLTQSDRARADIRDRVKDRVEDLTDRTRQAMRGPQNRTARIAISFAAGLGLGIGVGMLFAPSRGEETRSSIAEKVQGVEGRVRGRFSAAVERAPTGTEER
jgi:hypothetical protein